MAPVRTNAPARIPRRPIVAAVLGALTLGYWLVVYRWHLVQGDDFTSAAWAGQRRGAMSPAQWWAGYIHDYTQMNGRLADSVVRLVMLPGHWFWQLLGPLVFATLAVQLFGWGMAGAAGARWGRTLGRTPSQPDSLEGCGTAYAEGPPRGVAPLPWWAAAVLALGAAAVIPLLVRRVPTVTGDALFWTSATVTYVVPAVLVFAVAAACSAVARGAVPGRARIILITVVIGLAELMQEESAGAVVLIIAVAAGWPAARRRLPWVWLAATAGGLAVKLAAPGIRARVGTMGPAETAATGTAEFVRRAANAAQLLTWTAGPALLAAALLAVVTAVILAAVPQAASRVSRRAAAVGLVAALMATGAASGCLALAAYRVRIGMPVLDLAALRTGGLRAAALWSVGLLVLLLAALAVAGFALRRLWGAGPLLLLAGTGGALTPPFAVGVLTPRAYVIPYALCCAVVLSFAGTLLGLGSGRAPVTGRARVAARRVGRVEPGARRAEWVARRAGVVVAAGALLAGAVAAAPTVRRMPLDMRDNHAVWAGVERAMDQVRAGRCTRIEMPASFPHPAYLFGNGFSEWYEPAMILYFDLPAQTTWARHGGGDCRT